MRFGFAARDLVRDPEKDKVNIKAVDGLTVGGFSFAIAPGYSSGAVFVSSCGGCFAALYAAFVVGGISTHPSRKSRRNGNIKPLSGCPKTAEILSGCPDSLKTAQN